MRTTVRTLTPLVAAAVLALTLVGCSNGPSDSSSTTPPAASTPAASSGQPSPSASTLRLDADGCPVLPHGRSLCTGVEDSWGAPLDTDSDGTWQSWVNLTFSSDGTVTWRESATEAEGTGTWDYDGADTVVVRLDPAVPSLGTDRLSLKVDEFERSCGEPSVTEEWDALTATQPALRFEPFVC